MNINDLLFIDVTIVIIISWLLSLLWLSSTQQWIIVCEIILFVLVEEGDSVQGEPNLETRENDISPKT